MKYPIALAQRIAEVTEIVEEWSVEKDLDQVLNWLMQFDSEDIDLGVRIIKNLNVIGFEDLNRALTIAYSKLERKAMDKETKIDSENTLFAGIGDGAKSGAMIGYNFRIINELSEENFMGEGSISLLEERKIDNIVLVDDIVGTGDQATKEIAALTEKVTPLGVKNIFLLTAVGMKDGLEAISSNTKAHVFSAFEYSELDTAKCLDSVFYDGIPHEERHLAKARLEYYGKVASNYSLGYEEVGALIAFYYNTPNISLPIIWGSRNSWLPLFKRAVKINGINSYYKKIDSSITKRKKDSVPSRTNEFVLLVEGKHDEVFFDYMVSRIKNRLGFEKISVVAMGGFSSKRLIDNFSHLNSKFLYVIEDDTLAPPNFREKIIKNIGENPYILVKPIIDFVNRESLSDNERWSRLFARIENSDGSDERNVIRRAERDLRSMIYRSESRSKEFFSAHLDSKKIKVLEDDLIEKISEV